MPEPNRNPAPKPTKQPVKGIPPSPPPKPDDQPHALTFFVSSAERNAVLRVLGRGRVSRTEALLDRLGIARGQSEKRQGTQRD